MITVLPPFIVTAVVALLYFWLGGSGTAPAGAAMRRDVNFYLFAIVITAIVSIIGGWRLGTDWVDYAAWAVAAFAILACILRFRSGSTGKPSDAVIRERGPLESSSDRDR